MESLEIETKGFIELAIQLNQEGLEDIQNGNFETGKRTLMKQVSILNLIQLGISQAAKQELKKIIMEKRL